MHISSDEICNQIQYGQVSDKWKVFQPPRYPLAIIIMYGFLYVIIVPMLCTVCFGFIFMALGQSKLIQYSFWPMYTTYPFLAVIAIVLPFFVTWLLWWLEKRDRDLLLVLLPEGFIQYKPWHNEHRRQAKVIGYEDVKEIVCKDKLAGIALHIIHTSGEQEKVFISRKYVDGAVHQHAIGQKVVQRLLDDQDKFNKQKDLYLEN